MQERCKFFTDVVLHKTLSGLYAPTKHTDYHNYDLDASVFHTW
jgi:hypothetical protein